MDASTIFTVLCATDTVDVSAVLRLMLIAANVPALVPRDEEATSGWPIGFTFSRNGRFITLLNGADDACADMLKGRPFHVIVMMTSFSDELDPVEFVGNDHAGLFAADLDNIRSVTMCDTWSVENADWSAMRTAVNSRFPNAEFRHAQRFGSLWSTIDELSAPPSTLKSWSNWCWKMITSMTDRGANDTQRNLSMPEMVSLEPQPTIVMVGVSSEESMSSEDTRTQSRDRSTFSTTHMTACVQSLLHASGLPNEFCRLPFVVPQGRQPKQASATIAYHVRGLTIVETVLLEALKGTDIAPWLRVSGEPVAVPRHVRVVLVVDSQESSKTTTSDPSAQSSAEQSSSSSAEHYSRLVLECNDMGVTCPMYPAQILLTQTKPTFSITRRDNAVSILLDLDESYHRFEQFRSIDRFGLSRYFILMPRSQEDMQWSSRQPHHIALRLRSIDHSRPNDAIEVMRALLPSRWNDTTA